MTVGDLIEELKELDSRKRLVFELRSSERELIIKDVIQYQGEKNPFGCIVLIEFELV